jgi:hypothetical protein
MDTRLFGPEWYAFLPEGALGRWPASLLAHLGIALSAEEGITATPK